MTQAKSNTSIAGTVHIGHPVALHVGKLPGLVARVNETHNLRECSVLDVPRVPEPEDFVVLAAKVARVRTEIEAVRETSTVSKAVLNNKYYVDSID